jgi:hypothetical protein
MYITALAGSLRRLTFNAFPGHDVLTYDDDAAPEFKYVLLAKSGVLARIQTYLDSKMRISAVWLMDQQIINSPDLELVLVLHDINNEINQLDIGPKKMRLPGILTGNNMMGVTVSYTVSEIDSSVTKYINAMMKSSTTPTMNIFDDGEPDLILDTDAEPDHVCDCGGHALGYKDTDPYGHGHWCKALKVYGGKP